MKENLSVNGLIEVLKKAPSETGLYLSATMPINENEAIVDAGVYSILLEEDRNIAMKSGKKPEMRPAVLFQIRNFNSLAHSVCGGEDLAVRSVLRYLNNWDAFDIHIDSAPLPESRREKYNEIMAKYRNHEIDGRGVTFELTGWLANFDQESRREFVSWIVDQEL